MTPVLIDTDILSRFFRRDPKVVARFSEYVQHYDVIEFSIVSYYEILSGLRHRDACRQLEIFMEFSRENRILPLNREAADHAARLYAETRKAGTPVDDIDILIAGIALAHDRAVVTHNTAHFGMLPGVMLEDWTL
jgi:tRNA(fMet)-specific endonuclease VapC